MMHVMVADFVKEITPTLQLTCIAFGLPIGSDLEYADGVTLVSEEGNAFNADNRNPLIERKRFFVMAILIQQSRRRFPGACGIAASLLVELSITVDCESLRERAVSERSLDTSVSSGFSAFIFSRPMRLAGSKHTRVCFIVKCHGQNL